MPGHPAKTEVEYSTLPTPVVNPAWHIDPSIVSGKLDAFINHVIGITDHTLTAFFGKQDVRKYRLTETKSH